MKLSLNWLSDYIDLSGLTTNDIVNQMVKCGFEVESIEKMGEGTNLIVGEVIECKDHPDSDHLHVTKVNIGNEVLDIVCGAPNCRQGLKVIVAQIGAKLPGGEIKAGKIRGEASNGMLCSKAELGLDSKYLEAKENDILWANSVISAQENDKRPAGLKAIADCCIAYRLPRFCA